MYVSTYFNKFIFLPSFARPREDKTPLREEVEKMGKSM